MSDDKLNEQLELAKILGRWAEQSPPLKEILHEEQKKAFGRAGFTVIRGGSEGRDGSDYSGGDDNDAA